MASGWADGWKGDDLYPTEERHRLKGRFVSTTPGKMAVRIWTFKLRDVAVQVRTLLLEGPSVGIFHQT